MGDRFKVIANVAVCMVFIVRDIQPVMSTAERLVEVLPKEGVDVTGDCLGAEGAPESGGGGGRVGVGLDSFFYTGNGEICAMTSCRPQHVEDSMVE